VRRSAATCRALGRGQVREQLRHAASSACSVVPVLISLVMRYSLAIAVKREVALERMVRRSLGGNGRSRV